MKILHVITSLRTGGAEKLMVDLLPRLRSAGHEVELCVLDGIDTPFKSELLAKRIRIIELGRSANVYHPKYLWRLYRLLRHGDYDVVHTHNTAPQLFAAISSVYARWCFAPPSIPPPTAVAVGGGMPLLTDGCTRVIATSCASPTKQRKI